MTHAEIKAALLASYETDGGINHLDGVNLPSQESVNALCREVMHLFFPGYFEEKSLAKRDVPALISKQLTLIEQHLLTEVEKSLRFARHANPSAEARLLTLELLGRLP